MDNLIEMLKLLSDRTRLRILLLLNGRELCVCQLVGSLGMSQPRVSRQLALLKRSGLINDRRDGKWIHYSIREAPENEPLHELLRRLPQWLKGDGIFESDDAALRVRLEIQRKTGRCDMEAFGNLPEGAGADKD